MAFSLDHIVPWGRSFEEYTAMFNLKENDLGKLILGCSDGPASFNCTLTRRGGQIISLDPLYAYSREEIQYRINETFDEVLHKVEQNKDEFVWTSISTPSELGRVRMEAMHDFLADFDDGREEGRYIAGELPNLPFSERQFELALSSHFLFLYSERLSLEFHLHSIRELCRTAEEVRLFPLLELGSKTSRHVDMVLSWLDKEGYDFEVVAVDYEFQRGGNKMLRIYSSGLGDGQ